ncbi:hypothetical protein O6H91_09G121300 [Diphasiastrum complanatum]|uniref:Uncharacterized protein n=1 Tax=Diphasiastrum complanatum TaxID=34168 RepID=A0ACC2CTZ8_DIPCM|nr:hypothetical protein O6H91_09G121300 [Diphasiastrum complanatum]
MQTEKVADVRLHLHEGNPVCKVVGVGGTQMNATTEASVDETISNAGNTRSKAVEERIRQVVRTSQYGGASQLLAGGIAGAVSKTCTAPLARLTILFQVQGMHRKGSLGHASIFQEASRIFREEGVRAFWKGNLVTVVHRLPYSSINFFAYERYKAVLLNLTGKSSTQESLGVGMGTRLLAGGGAGITAASLTYPLDLVRTRLSAQTNVMYYKGIMHALVTISRDEGFRGLYKGMGTTLLGVGPNIAINFCAYETLKSIWVSKRPDYSNIAASLFCGSLAGICSSTATFPLDLVRRRMQLEGAAGRARVYKTGLVGTVSHIIQTEGWFGLYRGILPEYFKVMPSVGIVFMTYEFMKRLLQPH